MISAQFVTLSMTKCTQIAGLAVTSPREPMVASSALLIRERGAHPTAIADVLERSGAPPGSAYHYFPGGRTPLLCEAVDYAGEDVAAELRAAASALDALDYLFESYRKQLQRSDFRAGCPVVAVAAEAGDPDRPEQAKSVIDRAAAAFARWRAEIEQRLRSDGVPAQRADSLAMLVLSSFEGAVVVARASRELAPLDLAQTELRSLLSAEIRPPPESELRDD